MIICYLSFVCREFRFFKSNFRRSIFKRGFNSKIIFSTLFSAAIIWEWLLFKSVCYWRGYDSNKEKENKKRSHWTVKVRSKLSKPKFTTIIFTFLGFDKLFIYFLIHSKVNKKDQKQKLIRFFKGMLFVG